MSQLMRFLCKGQPVFRTFLITRCLATNCKVPSVNNLTVEQCYELFCLDEFCSLEELRQAYEVTIKRSTGGDVQRVQQLDKAYFKILQHRYNTEVHGDGTFDRKSFLNYEGVATGKPGLRRWEPQDVESDGSQTHGGRYRRASFKHTGTIERMMDTLVTRSFEKVDTSNLEGFGKPLPKHLENPYVDTLQRKLNEIMTRNDFSTDWLELQKEIQTTLATAKKVLTQQRHSFRMDVPNCKPTDKQLRDWTAAQQAFLAEVKKLNKRVDVFNLAVPVLRMQRTHYDPVKELEKLKKSWPLQSDRVSKDERSTVDANLPPSQEVDKTSGSSASKQPLETASLLHKIKTILGF